MQPPGGGGDTISFSSGNYLKYPVGVVLTPHAGIQSPDQSNFHVREAGKDDRGWRLCPQHNKNLSQTRWYEAQATILVYTVRECSEPHWSLLMPF